MSLAKMRIATPHVFFCCPKFNGRLFLDSLKLERENAVNNFLKQVNLTSTKMGDFSAL